MTATRWEQGANFGEGGVDITTLDLVDQTALLFSETRDYHQNEAVKRVLGEALGSLRMLKHRLSSVRDRYSVGVVGQTNVGKSTLLNALFGCEIAPRRNGPCTAAPIEFQYGDSWMLAVNYEQSLKRSAWACPDLSHVHMKLAEVGSGADAEAGRGIRKIVVNAPFELLRHGLIVCDTPGFNAAQTGEAEGQHEDSLKRYLKVDVSQVLWVVSAEQAIGKAEMDFHSRFFAEICDDIVVTNCDSEGEMWDDRDRDRFRKRYAARFGYRLPNFHFVSGSWGYEARQESNMDKLAEAGIPELEKRIRLLADPNTRMQDIHDTWNRLGDDTAAWLTAWERESGDSGKRWRPDSWARWLQAASVSDMGREMAPKLSAEPLRFPEKPVSPVTDPPRHKSALPPRAARQRLDAKNTKKTPKIGPVEQMFSLLGSLAGVCTIITQNVQGSAEWMIPAAFLFSCIAGCVYGWRLERIKSPVRNWPRAMLIAFAILVLAVVGFIIHENITAQQGMVLYIRKYLLFFCSCTAGAALGLFSRIIVSVLFAKSK